MLFESSLFRVLTTVVVYQRISKSTVEPSDSRFPLQFGFVLHGFYQGGLQDLFSCRTGGDAPLQESEKLPVVL
jgi:hypothetical protein